MDRRVGVAALGALLAVALQIVLAPNIAILGVMPSFIIVYALIVGMLIPSTPSYVIAFCLGMVGDLLGYGPVGALPLILLISTFALEHALEAFGNGTLFVSCIILLVFVIVVHFLHAAFMIAMTSSYSALDAFRLIALPASVYDCVLAVALYVFMRRILALPQSSLAHIGPLAK